jgi:hypothetical protein
MFLRNRKATQSPQSNHYGKHFTCPPSIQLLKSAGLCQITLHLTASYKCITKWLCYTFSRLRLKCDGTRAETRFHLSTKWTSPFKSAGASVQSTTGRRAVHISLQGLYYSCKPVFCSHVMLTGYPLHSHFPFTSPRMCYCVPSHFNWTLPQT